MSNAQEPTAKVLTLNDSLEMLRGELNFFAARAKTESSDPKCKVLGIVRTQLVKECRISLKLIEIGHRYGQ